MHLHFCKRAFAAQSTCYFLVIITLSLMVNGCGQTGSSELPYSSRGQSSGVPSQIFATPLSETFTPERQDNSATESGGTEVPLEGVLPAYSASTQLGEYDECKNLPNGITEAKRTTSESNTTTITLCIVGMALSSKPSLTVFAPDGREYTYSYDYLRGRLNFGTFPADTFVVKYHVPAGVFGTHILTASDGQNQDFTLEIQT